MGAAALLCAAVAGGNAALHAADLRRGPVPESARKHAELDLEVTVTGDPRALRPKVRGARQSQGLILVRADAVAVHRPDGGREAVRTPVLLFVQAGKPERNATDGASRTGPDAAQQWKRLLPSTRLRVSGRSAPPAPGRAGGRDVAAVLRVGPGAPRITAGPDTLQRAAGELRAGLRRATEGLDTEARGLLPGLVVGDTSRLRPELEAAFRTTDMTHLLAVSGSNLSILLVLLLGPPGLAHRVERRGLAAGLGIPLRATAVTGALLTLGFVVVCRPEPSVLRAAACGLITIAAIATGRRRSLLPALAAAVLLLVLFDPWLARDFGFLLSVLATASLLVVAPRWSDALRRRGWPARVAEAVAAAAAAQAACAPVVAVLAAHVSLVAVPCNLLAEFAVAPATVLGFGALVLAVPALPLAKALAWVAGWPTGAIAAIARTGAALPGAELGWPGSWWGALALAVGIGLAVVAARRFRVPHRPWPCAALGLLLCLALLRPVPLVRPLTGWPPPGWRMVACDVGQGDALVLAVDGARGGGGGAVVVDAGPEPAAVDRCLRELGVRKVPLAVLTHFHADHVAGLPGLLRGRRVGAIQVTARAEPPGQAAFVRRTAGQAGVPLVPAAVGERRRAGDLSWQVLWPPSPAEPSAPATEGTASGETAGDGETSGGAVGDAAIRGGAVHAGAVHAGAPSDGSVAQGEEGGGANDASITLLVRTGGLTLFLPGDLEPEAQQGLLALWPGLKRVDVLKVAHHGSRYQDGELQRRLHPRIAFVSAGSDNPYGHPAPETVHRLQASGALVARTDRHGALALVARPHAAPTVLTERGSPRGGADDGPAGPPAPPGAARPERAGRRGGRWFRRGGRTAQARGAGDGNGGGGRSGLRRGSRGAAVGGGRRVGAAGAGAGREGGRPGPVSRVRASPRARWRGRRAPSCRRCRRGPPGRPATGRPPRRPRPRAPHGRAAAPHRGAAAVPTPRRPPRPRPCRAAPAHAVRRSPRHSLSAAQRACGWCRRGMGCCGAMAGTRKKTSDDPLAPLTLVVGQEELLIERAVRRVIDAARAADADTDVRDLASGELQPGTLAELTSPSLFAERKVVVVRAAQDLAADTVKDVKAYLAAPAEEITLVLVHAGGNKGKGLLDAARKAGAREVECPKMTKPADRLAFVRGEFRTLGRSATPEACQALVDAIGSDLRELASACTQLTADVEGTIDEAVVGRYYTGRAEASSFTVADRAVEGRAAEALETLRWAVATGVAPVLITSALAQGVRAIGKLAGAPRGARPGDLARELGMPPWKIDRVRQQMRGWTPDGVAVALRAVADADAAVKGGGSDPEYALEKAVVTIARAARSR